MSFKAGSRSFKVSISEVMPLCMLKQATLSNTVFYLCLQTLGINSIATYIRKFPITTCLLAMVGGCLGGGTAGLLGAFLGSFVGFITPIAAVWLAINLMISVAYIGVYCAGWVLLFYVGRWIFDCAF